MSTYDPQAEFDLRDGSRLMLYANRLVHAGRSVQETVPYAHLASVRVAFERDPRRIYWAIVLALAALGLMALSAPMQSWFGSLAARAGEGSNREAVEAVLLASFNALRGLARMLPAVAAVLGAAALALAALFALGRTTLTIAFGATERSFGTVGRNRALIEFAEVIGEHVARRGT